MEQDHEEKRTLGEKLLGVRDTPYGKTNIFQRMRDSYQDFFTDHLGKILGGMLLIPAIGINCLAFTSSPEEKIQRSLEIVKPYDVNHNGILEYNELEHLLKDFNLRKR